MGEMAWSTALVFAALFVLPIISTDAERAQSGEALVSKASLGEGVAADEAPLVAKELAAKNEAKEAMQKLITFRNQNQKPSHNTAKKVTNGGKLKKSKKGVGKGKGKGKRYYDNPDKRTKWKAKKIGKGKGPWSYKAGFNGKNKWHQPRWGKDPWIVSMAPRSKLLAVCGTMIGKKKRFLKVNAMTPMSCAAHCNLYPFFAVEKDDDCGCFYQDPCKYKGKFKTAKNPKGMKPGKDRAYKNGRFVGSTTKQLEERVSKAHKKWKDDWAKRNRKTASGAASKKAKAKKQVKPKTIGETKGTGCNGWAPSHGKHKGEGKTCGRWGWTRSWCYVDKGFKGPGHEFIKPSENGFKGKYYMPCKMPKVTSGVLGEPTDFGKCVSEGGALQCATCQEKNGGRGALPCRGVPPRGNVRNWCKDPGTSGDDFVTSKAGCARIWNMETRLERLIKKGNISKENIALKRKRIEGKKKENKQKMAKMDKRFKEENDYENCPDSLAKGKFFLADLEGRGICRSLGHETVLADRVSSTIKFPLARKGQVVEGVTTRVGLGWCTDGPLNCGYVFMKRLVSHKSHKKNGLSVTDVSKVGYAVCCPLLPLELFSDDMSNNGVARGIDGVRDGRRPSNWYFTGNSKWENKNSRIPRAGANWITAVGLGPVNALRAGVLSKNKKDRAIFHGQYFATPREKKIFVDYCLKYAFDKNKNTLHPAYKCPSKVKKEPKNLRWKQWKNAKPPTRFYPKLTGKKALEYILKVS